MRINAFLAQSYCGSQSYLKQKTIAVDLLNYLHVYSNQVRVLDGFLSYMGWGQQRVGKKRVL